MKHETILEQMGISETDLRDLFQKFNAFLDGLNETQKNIFLNSEVSLREAAHTLRHVSPEELRAFLEQYTPPGGVAIPVCGHHHQKHREPESE